MVLNYGHIISIGALDNLWMRAGRRSKEKRWCQQISLCISAGEAHQSHSMCKGNWKNQYLAFTPSIVEAAREIARSWMNLQCLKLILKMTLYLDQILMKTLMNRMYRYIRPSFLSWTHPSDYNLYTYTSQIPKLHEFLISQWVCTV